ncbi:MAG TPA: PAS domain S-box protein [Ktedonobacteraceae bacterium]|jgi:PAS domain S-box-containing protein
MLGNPTAPLYWSADGAGPDQRSLCAWCTYTGQSPTDLGNWQWLAALHPADRDATSRAWQETLSHPCLLTLSYRIHHVHTGYQPFKALHVPVFSASHQVQSWLIFLLAEPASSPQTNEDWEIRLIYGMIYDQVVLGILCLSLDGHILRVNKRLSQLTGYTRRELLAMSIWQLSLPEDLHLHLQAIGERLTRNQSYPPFRTRYQRKDGSSLWVRVTQFLVRQPSGEPYYFFYVVEDVSAQVQAEHERAGLLARVQEAHLEALKRTVQLEAVFASITDGILVCDSQGNIIQSNPAVRQLLHLDAYPDFLHLSIEQRLRRLQGFNEQGHEVSLEQWPLKRLLRGECLNTGQEEDMRLILPDEQQIYVNHSGAPMRNQDGEIIGAVIIIHDVNERHLLEQRIRKSFRILLALAEELVALPKERREPVSPRVQAANGQTVATPIFETAAEYLVELTCQMMEYQETGISLLDPDNGHLHVVALAGSASEERVLYQQLLASTTLADYLNADEIALLCDNEVVIKEFSLHPHDRRFSNVLIAPMLFNGRLAGVLTVEKKELNPLYSAEEISLVKAIAKLILLVIERERLKREWIEAHSSELALREANRRFDEFLSLASHELRTPLAGIKGNIQLALRRLAALKSGRLPEMHLLQEKLDKLQEFLREAEQRVNVQNRMISDLLDVSRIQANKMELVMGPCSLETIVRQAVADQRYTMPARTITLKTPGNESLTVIGDADRLGQVIHNYLSNALKYSPSDQPVAVVIEKTKDSARVSVRDRGPGLPPEEQTSVWERFYRVKGIMAQGGAGPGLGLGLHICQTIIEAHHGSVGLHSIPGQGSTFWFALPLVQPHPPSCEQSSNTIQRHAR